MHDHWKLSKSTIEDLMSSKYLVYIDQMWRHSTSRYIPNSSILDLFQEEQTLESLIRQRDELNRRIEEWNKLEIGDVVLMKSGGIIGVVQKINYTTTPRVTFGKNVITTISDCQKLTKQEVIDLLFTKKGDV